MSRDEFLEDKPEAASGAEFRVADLLIRSGGDRLELYVSHHFWYRERQCYVLRVTSAEVDEAGLLDGTAALEWHTVFETDPCLTMEPSRFPFVGSQAGGRMVQLGEGLLLVAVGDQFLDGWNSQRSVSQDPSSDWGKMIRIDLATGESTIYSTGHRNPQGLFVTESGVLWSTEHGPRGGDELNRIVEGANYGWPLVTYGTEYGLLTWPPAAGRGVGRHDGYEPPIYTWLPSIGVSSVIVVERNLFEHWREDLIVGSLREGTLYRLRFENERIQFVEPLVMVNAKIRDLVEGNDGKLALLLDGGGVALLEPAPPSQDPDFEDAEYLEEILVSQCSECHPMSDGATHGIGPNLYGIVDRDIASAPEYSYSPALQSLPGNWTRERLDAFLAAPEAYAPGNAMGTEGISSSIAREIVINYLATVR